MSDEEMVGSKEAPKQYKMHKYPSDVTIPRFNQFKKHGYDSRRFGESVKEDNSIRLMIKRGKVFQVIRRIRLFQVFQM